MRLVVDANIVVAQALNERGQSLLLHPALELLMTERALSEAKHELEKRLPHLIKNKGLNPATAEALRQAAFAAVEASAGVVPKSQYDHLEIQASKRIADADDQPSIALALALDVGIWTEDRHFFGCGIPVWRTDVLIEFLRDQEKNFSEMI